VVSLSFPTPLFSAWILGLHSACRRLWRLSQLLEAFVPFFVSSVALAPPDLSFFPSTNVRWVLLRRRRSYFYFGFCFIVVRSSPSGYITSPACDRGRAGGIVLSPLLYFL